MVYTSSQSCEPKLCTYTLPLIYNFQFLKLYVHDVDAISFEAQHTKLELNSLAIGICLVSFLTCIVTKGMAQIQLADSIHQLMCDNVTMSRLQSQLDSSAQRCAFRSQ